MDELTNLRDADALLAKISVTGNDVFLLALARQKLKAAYDAFKEVENGK